MLPVIVFAFALFSSGLSIFYIRITLEQALGEEQIPNYMWNGLVIVFTITVLLWSWLYYLSH